MMKIIFKDRTVVYENAHYIETGTQLVHIYDGPASGTRKWIATIVYEPGMIIETTAANNTPEESTVRPAHTGPK